MTDAARAAALDLLDAVLRRRQTLEAAIAGHAALGRMPGADQAFAGRLTLTTVRRLGQIDDLVDRALDRPLPTKARIAQDVLRLGAAQLLFMEIPAHAAVDTSVELFRDRGAGGFAKLVNAVLRRLAREGVEWAEAQDAPRLNTPDWLWQSWVAAYGEDSARAIAAAHLNDPPLDITPKTDAAGWSKTLGGRVVAEGTVRLDQPGTVSGLAGYAEGAWWVQDAAARLVGSLLGDVRGKHVIDLCAAPGGKTAHLAAAGARVTAVDRSAARLERLRANLARLALSADIVEADAGTWTPAEPADAVLLDAPCSATGTLRRHPDVALGKSADDVRRLADLQARLLARAADMVKPGGILVYATCSLQPEEGPEIVTAMAGTGIPFEPFPISPVEAGGVAEAITPAGQFRSLPCHLAEAGGMDGFFAARSRRL
jgi:16S rRNA (cytosine967-C5)-methyltransferase